jgi:hypothetical protein
MKREKLPTKHTQLDQIKRAEYMRGWHDAEASLLAEQKKTNAGFTRQQLQTRMDALKAATQLASALGQSIGELSRAMCSEGGQL